MSTRVEEAEFQDNPEGRVGRHLLLGYGSLGGFGAWALHLVTVYFLVGPVCHASGGVWSMHLASAVLLLVALGTIVVSVRFWRNANGEFAWDMDGRGGWMGFLSLFGMISGALTSVAIIAAWVPVFIFNPCAT